jgi:hypothetical protein
VAVIGAPLPIRSAIILFIISSLIALPLNILSMLPDQRLRLRMAHRTRLNAGIWQHILQEGMDGQGFGGDAHAAIGADGPGHARQDGFKRFRAQAGFFQDGRERFAIRIKFSEGALLRHALHDPAERGRIVFAHGGALRLAADVNESVVCLDGNARSRAFGEGGAGLFKAWGVLRGIGRCMGILGFGRACLACGRLDGALNRDAGIRRETPPRSQRFRRSACIPARRVGFSRRQAETLPTQVEAEHEQGGISRVLRDARPVLVAQFRVAARMQRLRSGGIARCRLHNARYYANIEGGSSNDASATSLLLF